MKEKVKLVDVSGTITTIYIPTLTLSWSRFNYRDLILENTTDNLLTFLAQAFEELGGVPQELVIDNLKQFVQKARTNKGADAILNTKFEEFCKDYGITPRPCMPRRPQTKGKTETQNKTVDQLKNYNGNYTGILDMHEKLSVINKEDNEGSLERKIKQFFKYKLLVIDEVGFNEISRITTSPSWNNVRVFYDAIKAPSPTMSFTNNFML
ncbi:MAG: DDE-type integrase/transposase/recombinase [Lachnospiraceae bacterium]